MTKILCFGNSITYGYCDIELSGWVQRLRKFLDEKVKQNTKLYFEVYNLGIPGDTTEDLLKRFKTETKARLIELDKEDVIIIFSLGINDSQYIHDKASLRVSEGKFKENIKKLISLAKKITSKIIFVGLTPVDETKTIPIPWNTNKSYKNEYIQKYNQIIKSVCKDNKIWFVEIFEKWIKIDYKKLLEDGLHPNPIGHENIFENIREFLVKNKIIF
jgi:lysophospholipase L1-like esterase